MALGLLLLFSLMPSTLPTPYAGGAMLQSSLPLALSLEELEVGEAVQRLEHLLLLQLIWDGSHHPHNGSAPCKPSSRDSYPVL